MYNKSQKWISFVGYSEQTKAYRLINLVTCKITIGSNLDSVENYNLNEKNDIKKRKPYIKEINIMDLKMKI